MKIKKKHETSKLIAYVAVVALIVHPLIAELLAVFEKDTVSEQTVAIITGCTSIIVAYYGKSLGEKASRNKHGLDENGQPYRQADPEDNEEENEL